MQLLETATDRAFFFSAVLAAFRKVLAVNRVLMFIGDHNGDVQMVQRVAGQFADPLQQSCADEFRVCRFG